MTKRLKVETKNGDKWGAVVETTLTAFLENNPELAPDRRRDVMFMDEGESVEWPMGAHGTYRIVCTSSRIETYGDLANEWTQAAVNEYLRLRRDPAWEDEEALRQARSSISIRHHVVDIALQDFDTTARQIKEDDRDYAARVAGGDCEADNREWEHRHLEAS